MTNEDYSKVPPPHLLKKFSEQARKDSNKRGRPGYCKTFAKLCIDWALDSKPSPRDLIKLLIDALKKECNWIDNPKHDELIAKANIYLAQSGPVAPTDEELLELMPETMRDEFGYAAKVCSDATGGQVKPGIFRVCLNHTALEYARAVLAAGASSHHH